MAEHATRYIPAAGHDLFTPLYDPMVRLFMRERAFRQTFFEQADIHPGHRVLDLGCGTGTMAILIRRQVPDAVVVGVDGDRRILAIAQRKAARISLSIPFDNALADRLPYADASFDRVLSSLVFHHLTHEEKLGALREIRRVLAPGASFHLADFAAPVGWWAGLVTRVLAHGERLGENLAGALAGLVREAGLENVEDRGYYNTALFGTVGFLSARRSKSA
jgi:ubiquinone/menaquinone biosynthesis C-methylase UbiE